MSEPYYMPNYLGEYKCDVCQSTDVLIKTSMVNVLSLVLLVLRKRVAFKGLSLGELLVKEDCSLS
jgi:hypothetical protein